MNLRTEYRFFGHVLRIINKHAFYDLWNIYNFGQWAWISPQPLGNCILVQLAAWDQDKHDTHIRTKVFLVPILCILLHTTLDGHTLFCDSKMPFLLEGKENILNSYTRFDICAFQYIQHETTSLRRSQKIRIFIASFRCTVKTKKAVNSIHHGLWLWRNFVFESIFQKNEGWPVKPRQYESNWIFNFIENPRHAPTEYFAFCKGINCFYCLGLVSEYQH